ncbi:MAG: hypothetical protein HRF45_09415 [Fimbriimonadia bacterium]
MRKFGFRNLVLALTFGGVIISGVSCGGGSAGGDDGGGTGISRLRIQVVTYVAGQQIGVAGAQVYGVLGTGAGATVVAFVPNSLDPTRYDLVNPPVSLSGILIRPPQTNPPSFHRVVQYPALPFNDSSNVYQMPDTVPYDPAIYAVPRITGPFPGGVTDLGQAKLYPYGDPPPNPNFP